MLLIEAVSKAVDASITCRLFKDIKKYVTKLWRELYLKQIGSAVHYSMIRIS